MMGKSYQTYEYVQVTSPTNQTVNLHVTVGSVTADRTAAYRRTCQITCFDPDGTLINSATGTSSALLTPFGSGSIIRPYSGIRYSDGTTEVYPLGVFNISQVNIVESNPTTEAGLTISMTGYDPSRRIDRNKFTSTYVIAAGTLITTAIQTLVNRTLPGTQFSTTTSGLTLPYPLTYAVGDSPWAAIGDLSASVGCETYFDVNGVCVTCPPADLGALSSPVMSYIPGQHCSMTDITSTYTDDPGYNGVIVIGASPATGQAAVQGVAWDTNPASPTYYLGDYGQVPQIVNDTNITTAAGALASATSLLNSQLGFVKQLSTTNMGPGNPALDVDDVVEIVAPKAAVNGVAIIDAVTVPMGESQTGVPSGYNSQALTLRNASNF
jgi:Domain of unknown function (DUF5047)